MSTNTLLAKGCRTTETKAMGRGSTPAQQKPKQDIEANPPSLEQEIYTSRESEGEGVTISEQ